MFDPFGNARGTNPASGTFPGNRGLLNDPVDSATNLTSIGARWYDSSTGTFISLDPMLETTSPDQLNGYTYAADNPVNDSDPTGLSVPGRSICTGSVDCNGSGDSPPSGWSGPGTANPNYKGTGALTISSGDTTITAPSAPALVGADVLAENQIGNGTGYYWAGDLGLPVTSDNPYVQAAIIQAICSDHSSWCVQRQPSAKEQILGTLDLLFGMVAGEDPELGAPLAGGLEGETEASAGILQTAEDDASATSEEASGQAIVSAGKYDYIFGRVTTDDHNASRSAQNNNQLARVGIYNNPEGIEILQSFFDGVVGDDSNIMKSYTNKFGNYQVRNALLAGPGGFIRMETTWQVLNDGNYRLTTAIPFGG